MAKKSKKISKTIEFRTESGLVVGTRPNPQFIQAERRKKALESQRTGKALGRSISQFAQAGLQQPQDLSFEQDVMEQMMGGGRRGSIWGANDAVHINHDLNARQRGDMGTAEVFGMA